MGAFDSQSPGTWEEIPMIELRDHSQPCKHNGPDWEDCGWRMGAYDDDGTFECFVDGCPGGKIVVVHELAPASEFVFPLVKESALVYATDERVSYSHG
jgi:hypothetical protein